MPLQHPSCFEVPGFITPQLHMLDYRRISPHVAPTTAHQNCRSNYQNTMPSGRVMASSEVQTEPLCHSIGSHGPAARSDTCSESGRGTGCDSPVSTTPRSTENKSIACPEGMSVLTQNCNTSATETTDLSAVPKSEIIQAERVQVKCGVMPSKHESIQNKNNIEMASCNKNNIMQCSLGSVQSSEDVVVCSYRSLAFREDKQRVEAGMLRYSSKHRLTSCTELNVLRTPSNSKPSKSVLTQCVKVKKNSETQFQTKGKDDRNSHNNNDDNENFKVLRLPFDVKNHKLPCQLDASIWSVESLLPYVPSSEWLAENGLLTPQKTLSSLTESNNFVSKPYCFSVGKNLQTDPSAKYSVPPHQLEASIWSVDSLMPYVPSNEWMVENVFSTPHKGMNPQNKSGDSHSSTDGIPLRKNLQTCGSTKYHGVSHQLEASIWSVESLMPDVPSNECMVENGLTSHQALSPHNNYSNVVSELNQTSSDHFQLGDKLQACASTKRKGSFNSHETCSPYRPSSSWLADFGNVYYYSKLSAVQQQSEILERWQPNESLATHLESSFINVKKTRNQTLTTGISDQKHCFSNKCKCKVQRSPRLSCVTLESKLPFVSYRHNGHKGKDQKKHSDCLSCKREENVEVKTFDKIYNEGVLDAKNMALENLLPECCTATQVELRQQTGLCDCLCLHASPAQDKCGDLGWRFWEKNEEDFMNQKKNLIRSQQKGMVAKILAKFFTFVCLPA